MADPSLPPPTVADRFGRLEWAADDRSFTLAGQRYLVEDVSTEQDPDAFRFYKPRSMVDQYERFLTQIDDELPRDILELGIWDGGSVAFWCELLEPTHHLAIDKGERGDSELFGRHVAEHGLQDVVDCRWGVDQADHRTIWALLDEHGLDQLDLVIDDASHSYGPTLASFAGLFPRVRAGGYYIIEDWSWPFREPFRRKDHPWATRPDLLPIVYDLLAALGSETGAISQVQVFADFVAIRRGPRTLEAPIDLAALIRPRERPHLKLTANAARRYGRKALRVAREATDRARRG